MRRPRRGWAGVAVALTVVSAVVGLRMANATTISLAAQPLSTATGAHPCPGTAAVTAVAPSGGSSSGVQVAVPAGCEGRSLSVVLLNGTAVVASGSGTVATSGATTVTMTTYTPTAGLTAQLVAAGWATTATWTFVPSAAITCYPVDPTVTATCTATVTSWDFWGSGYRVNFTVSTPSTTPFAWEVRLDLAATGQAAPGGTGTYFPGYPVPAGSWWSSWTPSHFSSSNLCADSRAGELPIVRLRGSATWSSTVSAGSPVSSLGFQANQNGSGTINSLGC